MLHSFATTAAIQACWHGRCQACDLAVWSQACIAIVFTDGLLICKCCRAQLVLLLEMASLARGGVWFHLALRHASEGWLLEGQEAEGEILLPGQAVLQATWKGCKRRGEQAASVKKFCATHSEGCKAPAQLRAQGHLQTSACASGDCGTSWGPAG